MNLVRILKPAAILCSCLAIFLLTACGPSQEELKIGALQHFNRGNQYLESDNPTAAIDAYRMAIAMDSEQAVFYYNMGLAFYRLVLYEQAIEAYQQAIRYKPDFAEAWYNLSLAYDKRDKTEKAFTAYNQYLQLNREETAAAAEADEPQPLSENP